MHFYVPCCVMQAVEGALRRGWRVHVRAHAWTGIAVAAASRFGSQCAAAAYLQAHVHSPSSQPGHAVRGYRLPQHPCLALSLRKQHMTAGPVWVAVCCIPSARKTCASARQPHSGTIVIVDEEQSDGITTASRKLYQFVPS